MSAASAVEPTYEGEREVCANGGGFMKNSLQKAAHSGDVKSLEVALECTATNIDAIDHEGQTALMIAAAAGHDALVKALCDAGADTTITNGDGLTAEDFATTAGHDKCSARIRKAREQRASMEAIIMQLGMVERQRSGGAAATDAQAPPPTASRSMVPRGEDLMARLLAEAGVPKGAAESPF